MVSDYGPSPPPDSGTKRPRPETVEIDGTTYVRAYPVAPGRCACCGAGPRAWTPATVIAALQADPAPKADRWLQPVANRPTFSTVRRMFGTWNAAIEAAGLGRRGHGMQTYWTRERIVEAMVAWSRAHDGKPPTYADWQRGIAEHPSATTVRKLFGSWNAAIDAAGFVPRAHWGNRARSDRAVKQSPDSMIDAAPLQEALWLVESGELDGIAEAADVSADYLYRIKRGMFAQVRLSFADRILTAMDRPDVLAAAA